MTVLEYYSGGLILFNWHGHLKGFEVDEGSCKLYPMKFPSLNSLYIFSGKQNSVVEE